MRSYNLFLGKNYRSHLIIFRNNHSRPEKMNLTKLYTIENEYRDRQDFLKARKKFPLVRKYRLIFVGNIMMISCTKHTFMHILPAYVEKEREKKRQEEKRCKFRFFIFLFFFKFIIWAVYYALLAVTLHTLYTSVEIPPPKVLRSKTTTIICSRCTWLYNLCHFYIEKCKIVSFCYGTYCVISKMQAKCVIIIEKRRLAHFYFYFTKDFWVSIVQKGVLKECEKKNLFFENLKFSVSCLGSEY